MNRALLVFVLLVATVLPVVAQRDYPIMLKVWSAQRHQNRDGVTTQIVGSLSDDQDAKKLHMTCDTGIFSLGPDGQRGNEYPARHDKTNEIKISTRDQGSDKVREHTCKF